MKLESVKEFDVDLPTPQRNYVSNLINTDNFFKMEENNVTDKIEKPTKNEENVVPDKIKDLMKKEDNVVTDETSMKGLYDGSFLKKKVDLLTSKFFSKNEKEKVPETINSDSLTSFGKPENDNSEGGKSLNWEVKPTLYLTKSFVTVCSIKIDFLKVKSFFHVRQFSLSKVPPNE